MCDVDYAYTALLVFTHEAHLLIDYPVLGEEGALNALGSCFWISLLYEICIRIIRRLNFYIKRNMILFLQLLHIFIIFALLQCQPRYWILLKHSILEKLGQVRINLNCVLGLIRAEGLNDLARRHNAANERR